MASLAIYTPTGNLSTVNNPFGKDTANVGLFKALALHGGFEDIGFLTLGQASEEYIATALFNGSSSKTRIWTDSILKPSAAIKAGAVLRGSDDLADLAWMRNGVDPRGFSLIGLIHTLAPPALRARIASAATSPIQAWDALICTSPAVQRATRSLFDEIGEFLGNRFNSEVRPRPYLPLIPLGVDAIAIARLADRPDVRLGTRNALGISAEDVLVLWLGRLSFFEKAFPQPMFRALEEAQAATGRRVHFVMAGWFPNPAGDRNIYEEAAQAYGPEITLHIVDGNDRDHVGALWAAADIFLSMVDNIQETFGLTPLEAMAAGLPVVASDWDGYNFTIRNGIEGFLIPTLGGPPGAGQSMVARHIFGLDTYQAYVGTVAQHTAIDIGRAADALAALIRDPALRRRMGEAGRERVRNVFDWAKVAIQVRDLAGELAAIRAKAAPFGSPDPVQHTPRHNPVKGDPFVDFADFPTSVLVPGTLLFYRPAYRRATAEDIARLIDAELARLDAVRLNGFAAIFRVSPKERTHIVRQLARRPATVSDVLNAFVAERRYSVALTLVWMCKLGILGWKQQRQASSSRAPQSLDQPPIAGLPYWS